MAISHLIFKATAITIAGSLFLTGCAKEETAETAGANSRTGSAKNSNFKPERVLTPEEFEEATTGDAGGRSGDSPASTAKTKQLVFVGLPVAVVAAAVVVGVYIMYEGQKIAGPYASNAAANRALRKARADAERHRRTAVLVCKEDGEQKFLGTYPLPVCEKHRQGISNNPKYARGFGLKGSTDECKCPEQ